MSLGLSTVQAQTPASDNTKTNAVKMNSTEKTITADGLNNYSAYISLTQPIRTSVVAHKSLPTHARYVKVVTVNEAVTLNGVVGDN